MKKRDLILTENGLNPRDDLGVIIAFWAQQATSKDAKKRPLLMRDKINVVTEFFHYTGKTPVEVTPFDVMGWLTWMRTDREPTLKESTIYKMVNMVSSFFRWAIKGSSGITVNPVDMARPEPPKPYENSKALTKSQVKAIFQEVRQDMDDGKIWAWRDYAMLTFFLSTGHRRREVCHLKWGDLTRDEDRLIVRFTIKGGNTINKLVHERCWETLIGYLRISNRYPLKKDDPLWIAHDLAQGTHYGNQMTSKSFGQALKKYATRAGVGHVHIHQLRHTAASMVANTTGDIGLVQDMLEHKNVKTTRIYVQRVGTRNVDAQSAILIDELEI